MKARKSHCIALALSCSGMMLATTTWAAQTVTDVALQAGGQLTGQVVDAQGVAVTMAPVAVLRQGREIAQVQTDQSGQFTVSGLKGGVYQVVAAGQQGVYRLWAPQTAPPSAGQALRIMAPADVVRGQYGPSGFFQRVKQFVTERPILSAGIVAAAIAIPVAIADDDSTS